MQQQRLDDNKKGRKATSVSRFGDISSLCPFWKGSLSISLDDFGNFYMPLGEFSLQNMAQKQAYNLVIWSHWRRSTTDLAVLAWDLPLLLLRTEVGSEVIVASVDFPGNETAKNQIEAKNRVTSASKKVKEF